VVAALVGPLLYVLMTDQDSQQFFLVSDLLGSRLASLFEAVGGVPSFSRDALIFYLPFALIVTALMKASFSTIQWFLWERNAEKVCRDLRSDIVRTYLKMNPMVRLFDDSRDKQLSSMLSTDIRYLREYIVRFYGGLPREGLQTFSLMITLYLLSSNLFFIFLFGVAPVVLMVSRLGKKLRRRSADALKDYSELTEWLQQRLLGIETIKHYQSESLEFKKMMALNESMFTRFFRAARVKARTAPLIELVAMIAFAVVLFIAFREVQLGHGSSAVELSFFATLALLSQSAGKLGKYFNSNRETAAAIERVDELYRFLSVNQRTQPERNLKPTDNSSGVEFENVSLLYPQSQVEALKKLSYQFEPGKFYCICGPSGAGKSSMFNLLLGLVHPTDGAVKVAGDSALIRCDHLGYLPQAPKLLSATLLENVSYPNWPGDESKAKRALEEVGLGELLGQLESGLQTNLGDNGRNLSGGQIQRVHLARLYYHNYPILVVDEGTSALDPENEQLVFKHLKARAGSGAVVINVAHRPAVFDVADEILLLDKGELLIAGERDLVMSSPAFKEFLNSEL